MSEFLNEQANALVQGGIRAFFDKAAHYDNVINLGIGEPAESTPEEIIKAAFEAANNGYTHYTANAGLIETRIAVSNYLAKMGVLSDPESEIMITCGGMGALSIALSCVIGPGTEVLIQDPQWLNYRAQVQFLGGTVKSIPVTEQKGFALSAEQIEKVITPQSRILMINSPNNPTGSIIDENELKNIAELAIAHNLLVISDEVYCELLYDGRKHHSIAAIPGMKERTIVVNSFSKSFAMTGWRVGFISGPPSLVQKMVYLQENYFSCANAFCQKACAYALNTMCGVEAMRQKYEHRRNIVWEGLNKTKGITCRKPEGAFYIFANIKETGKSSLEMAEYLLEKCGVITVPGSAFGSMGEGYLRLSYANSDELLTEAMNRMHKLF